MLAAIGAAKHRVAFEGYIYNSQEDIARQFTDAFVAAAQRGVECRLVFDAFGAKVVTMTPRGWRRPGVESAGSTRCVAGRSKR